MKRPSWLEKWLPAPEYVQAGVSYGPPGNPMTGTAMPVPPLNVNEDAPLPQGLVAGAPQQQYSNDEYTGYEHLSKVVSPKHVHAAKPLVVTGAKVVLTSMPPGGSPLKVGDVYYTEEGFPMGIVSAITDDGQAAEVVLQGSGWAVDPAAAMGNKCKPKPTTFPQSKPSTGVPANPPQVSAPAEIPPKLSITPTRQRSLSRWLVE